MLKWGVGSSSVSGSEGKGVPGAGFEGFALEFFFLAMLNSSSSRSSVMLGWARPNASLIYRLGIGSWLSLSILYSSIASLKSSVRKDSAKDGVLILFRLVRFAAWTMVIPSVEPTGKKNCSKAEGGEGDLGFGSMAEIKSSSSSFGWILFGVWDTQLELVVFICEFV